VPVSVDRRPDGTCLIRQKGTLGPFESADPDSQRLWWLLRCTVS